MSFFSQHVRKLGRSDSISERSSSAMTNDDTQLSTTILIFIRFAS